MSGLQLDADARKALDVALGTAAAMGDERCGTEYLLFGVVATASGEMAEVCTIFALDSARMERGIMALRSHRFEPSEDGHVDPPCSPRAEMALHGRSLSGDELRSPFDILLGALSDPRSGAATVLRHLGVRLGEIRRLVELGAARLDRREVEGLIKALDRRDTNHYSWWGPDSDGAVARIGKQVAVPRLIARSQTAEVTLDALVVGTDGFGFGLTVRSLGAWVLPPSWEPEEVLNPGLGSEHRLAPDFVTVDLRYGDGTQLTNRGETRRWRADMPTGGALIRLGTRRLVEDRNDRRQSISHTETTEWWAWPLPLAGPLALEVSWPAEAIEGNLELDATVIAQQADALRTNSR